MKPKSTRWYVAKYNLDGRHGQFEASDLFYIEMAKDLVADFDRLTIILEKTGKTIKNTFREVSRRMDQKVGFIMKRSSYPLDFGKLNRAIKGKL